MSLETFLEKAKDFKEPESIVYKESEILDFTNKFPKDQIGNLTIDEYAQGTDKNSFCYWLEFKEILFGIGGGNASKFGIYKSKDGLYCSGYWKNKKILSEVERQSLFDSIKKGIIEALKCAEENRIGDIKNLNIPIWNMVLQKILTIYYPDKFIPIGASDALIRLAKDINLDNIELKAENLIEINYECKKRLKETDVLKYWDLNKFGTFIWNNYRTEKEEPPTPKTEGQKYWLYSPGEKAMYWETYYGEGIMGIGWNAIGNFQAFNSKESIYEKIKEIIPSAKNPSNDAFTDWQFLNEIKSGDVIIAKKGRKVYLGYGIVKSDCYYDPLRKDYHNLRKVEWKAKGEWDEYDRLLPIKSLTDISKDPEYVKKLKSLLKIKEFPVVDNQQIGTVGDSIEPNFWGINANPKYPLNTIFYGPPGTGKTYHTVLRAAQIIQNRVITDYDQALRIFNENLGDSIEFITFHQNYSYEDFIQGLRPDVDDGTELSFERKDGVFKRIADRALKNLLDSEKRPEEISKNISFDAALEKFKDHISETEEFTYISDTFYIANVERDAFRYKSKNAKGEWRMKFSDLKEFYLQGVKNRKDIKDLKNISGLAKVDASYYFKVYEKILSYLTETNVDINEVKRQYYVIIIDEINRANISRVFGELITLIELDKRSHGKIPMKCTLPSGETFIVPSNLYIIGTMNTADKSIALLDIALRRRFEFEAFYPLYEIEDHTIYDKEILKKINEGIRKLKGYDFQIGHSYFMGDNDDLKKRMNKKVIPLLMEYFMNDEDEVKKILVNAGLSVEQDSWPIKINGLL